MPRRPVRVASPRDTGMDVGRAFGANQRKHRRDGSLVVWTDELHVGDRVSGLLAGLGSSESTPFMFSKPRVRSRDCSDSSTESGWKNSSSAVQSCRHGVDVPLEERCPRPAIGLALLVDGQLDPTGRGSAGREMA